MIANVARDIFSRFSFESYNVYWLLVLLSSVVVTSIAAVATPNVFKKTHHRAIKALNEFFARQQLAYIVYYLSVLAFAGVASDQRWLKQLMIMLVVLGLPLSLLSAFLASPSRQDGVLEKDHQCPKDASEVCHQRVKAKTLAKLYWANLAVFAGSAVVAMLITLTIKEESLAKDSRFSDLGALAAVYLENLQKKERGELLDEDKEALRGLRNLIDGNRRAGGVVDDDYYLGMLAFFLGERQTALEKLGEFVKGRSESSNEARLARARYVRGVTLQGLGHEVGAVEKCEKLLGAYEEVSSAVKMRSEKEYQLLRSNVAADILRAGCTGIDLAEMKAFAAGAEGPAYYPPPELYLALDATAWKFVGHAQRAGIARYQLSLGGIPVRADYGSILVETRSPKWPIRHGTRGLPAGAFMPQDQEPALSVSEERMYAFFFPKFEPELGWYLLVDLRVGTHRPQSSELRTRIGYVRFP